MSQNASVCARLPAGPSTSTSSVRLTDSPGGMSAGRAGGAQEGRQAVCNVLVYDLGKQLTAQLEQAARGAPGHYRIWHSPLQLSALRKLESWLVDIFLVNFRDNRDAALQAVERADARGRAVKIVAVLPTPDADLAAAAIARGATTCVVEGDPVLDAGLVLSSFHRGLIPMNAEIATQLIARLRHHVRTQEPAPAADDHASCLTDREVEILQLSARGLKQKEIAGVLGLSPHTISGYFKRIYEKLNVNSRSEAIFEASELGYVRLY